MIKYTFSGHESFQCKDLWLKKGYDYIKSQKSFNDNTAVVDLGVGKNMVSSIRYWIKSFGLIDDNSNLTDFSIKLFDDLDGYDPYMEDVQTLWILHYKLVTLEIATIYNLTFLEFHREYKEFTREQLQKFIKRKCSEVEIQYPYNENTVKTDIGVLLKNYVKPDGSSVIIDDFSSLMIDLELLEKKSFDIYSFSYQTADKISPDIALFIILDYFQDSKVIDFISLAELFFTLCIMPDDLIDIIRKIESKYSPIVYSDDAGIRQIQILERIDKWTVLNDYYINQNHE